MVPIRIELDKEKYWGKYLTLMDILLKDNIEPYSDVWMELTEWAESVLKKYYEELH